MRKNPKNPSYQHEKAVLDYLAELSSKGWKTIRLGKRSPDGIAVKDNRVVAVEIIIKNTDGKYRATDTTKRDDYFMFDDVFIKKFDRDSNIEKQRIEYENRLYSSIRKKRDEEKINEAWDRYGV
jgi:hypothetical protein